LYQTVRMLLSREKELDIGYSKPCHFCLQCQLGVLPLGTGNDLSRVLGWGTSFDDDNALTQFLRHLERAKAAVLDRYC